jgi:hypothetical protein
MLAFGLFIVTRLSALELILSCPSLALKDGRHFTAVEFVNYTANGVLVRHAEGATTIRLDLLPSQIAAALHLQPWEIAGAANAGFDPSLADRPAVSEGGKIFAPISAGVADRLAVADTAANSELADRPAIAVSESPADAVATNNKFTLPVVESVAAIAPSVTSPANPAGSQQIGGRVVVNSPSGGTFLLGDVEIRAYPAHLLPAYLAEAKAQCSATAEELRSKAAAAAANGNDAAAASLRSRAAAIAKQYLDYLPRSPFSTRSDEFGFFTLEHTLADVRIVAVGHLSAAQGEWNYEWIGVTPEQETNLTEVNATVVVSPVGNAGSRFTAR